VSDNPAIQIVWCVFRDVHIASLLNSRKCAERIAQFAARISTDLSFFRWKGRRHAEFLLHMLEKD
ncbi:hypothetical protein ACCS53_39720, partial [Rhizobium ruizarguesonis]